MRVQSAVLLVAIVCLLPLSAAADITSISPESISVGTLGGSLTVEGTGLTGTESTFVLFDGPAGQFFVVPSIAGDTLVALIPDEVATSPGPYVINVAITNTGEEALWIGFAIFNVQEPVVDGPPIISSNAIIVAEATSPAGAVIDLGVSAQSPIGTPVPVTCSPASGSQFAVGVTSVSCSATNVFGTTNTGIYVLVIDLTSPVVTVPADIVTTDEVVSFSVSAVDNIDGTVPVQCTPSSGTAFPDGITQVVCTATDSGFNTGVGTFLVTRPGGLPELTVPADVTLTSPNGDVAEFQYEATATNDAIVVCLPSGYWFVVGNTTVDCTATNLTGSVSKSFDVVVVSGLAPEITVPANITAEATSPAGAAVAFTATATNAGVVVCTPPSGSTFALGTTTVNCTATNAGGADSDSFTVTVVDTTAPILSLPDDITAEATSSAGAAVNYVTSATDLVDTDVAVQCTPASGDTFALGTTTVSCSATDDSGNSATGSFDVTVVDTTAPILSLPDDITAEATSSGGVAVNYVTSATDLVDTDVAVQCTPASGDTFALGTTTVSCSATDDSGNSATGSFDVTVVDTTPPQILSVEATPNVLWPPNHKMVDISVVVVAVDAVDPSPVSRIISVSSNQPVNGTGDGDTAPDWQITGPLTVQLRSERSHGIDRTYTITVESVDDAGNASTATTTVIVSQGRRRAVR